MEGEDAVGKGCDSCNHVPLTTSILPVITEEEKRQSTKDKGAETLSDIVSRSNNGNDDFRARYVQARRSAAARKSRHANQASMNKVSSSSSATTEMRNRKKRGHHHRFHRSHETDKDFGAVISEDRQADVVTQEAELERLRLLTPRIRQPGVMSYDDYIRTYGYYVDEIVQYTLDRLPSTVLQGGQEISWNPVKLRDNLATLCYRTSINRHSWYKATI